MRSDDCVCSDWFEVEQGLLQECVVPPHLHCRADRCPPKIQQRFSKDTVILAELVHLKEPPKSMGPEPAMDYVRRAVRSMLYADEACIVS